MTPRSKLWKYFTKKCNYLSTCNLCHKTLKTAENTTNLVVHLKIHHNNIFKDKDENTEQISELQEPVQKGQVPKHQNIDNSEQEKESSKKSPTPRKKSLPIQEQPSIVKAMKTVASFSDGGSKSLKITNELVNMICIDNLPFAFVDGRGFRNLMKEVAPLYKVPTRNTMKQLIEKKYETLSNIFKERIKCCKSVTLTTDIWTDSQTKNFLGITVHFISGLILESGTLGIVELIDLLERIRKIVVWFKRSVSASDDLRKEQRAQGQSAGCILKVVIDVKTRWNSTYYMIERFLQLSTIISNIILRNVDAPNMVSVLEMEQIKEIKKILHTLENLTTEICGEKYVTLSLVIPMVACVTEEYSRMKSSFNMGKNLIAALQHEFSRRFRQIEQCHALAHSTFLDPRFKNIHFRDPTAYAKVIKSLRTSITTSQGNNNDEDDISSDDVNCTNEEGELDIWAHHKLHKLDLVL